MYSSSDDVKNVEAISIHGDAEIASFIAKKYKVERTTRITGKIQTNTYLFFDMRTRSSIIISRSIVPSSRRNRI